MLACAGASPYIYSVYLDTCIEITFRASEPGIENAGGVGLEIGFVQSVKIVKFQKTR